MNEISGKIYDNITQVIGSTPVIRLNNLKKKYKLKGNILAKCEFLNPFASSKDRIALSMIERTEKKCEINPETVFVIPTSGNTGISLAAICSSRKYKLVITMPENMSIERIKLMRHLGAEVLLTPASDGMKGAIKKAEILAKKNKNVILLKQFEDEANPDAHRFNTAMELIRDTNGDIDVFVAGVGTGGTLTGCAEVLKNINNDLYVVAVEPAESPVLSGGLASFHKIQGIGAGFVPKILNTKIIDEIIRIEDDDAYKYSTELSKTEGMMVGISSGAVIKAAIDLSKRDEMKGKNIVVVLASSAERYMSTELFL
jgi:cysteine synthase A